MWKIFRLLFYYSNDKFPSYLIILFYLTMIFELFSIKSSCNEYLLSTIFTFTRFLLLKNIPIGELAGLYKLSFNFSVSFSLSISCSFYSIYFCYDNLLFYSKSSYVIIEASICTKAGSKLYY